MTLSYTVLDGQYLIAHTGREGILIRGNAQNNVYFSTDVSMAKELIEILLNGGPQILKRKCTDNPKLQAQWDDMSSNGFFWDISNVDCRAYHLCFDLGIDSGQAVFDLIKKTENLLLYTCDIRVRVPNLDDIVTIYNRYKDIPSKYSGKRKLHFISSFNGECNCINQIIELMDKDEFDLIYNYERDEYQSERCQMNLNAFEDLGFVVPYEIVATSHQIMNESYIASLTAQMESFLQRSPNRYMDLVIKRPDAFISVEHVESFYDHLDSFIKMLFSIDADVSCISLFGNYLKNILVNRYYGNFISVRIVNDHLVASSRAGENNIEQIASYSNNVSVLLNKIKHNITKIPAACRKCEFVFICSRKFNTSFNNMIDEAIFTRECMINKTCYGMILEDLFLSCKNRMSDARTLVVEKRNNEQLNYTEAR